MHRFALWAVLRNLFTEPPTIGVPVGRELRRPFVLNLTATVKICDASRGVAEFVRNNRRKLLERHVLIDSYDPGSVLWAEPPRGRIVTLGIGQPNAEVTLGCVVVGLNLAHKRAKAN